MASKELKCFQDQIAIHNNGDDDNNMTDCDSDSGDDNSICSMDVGDDF